MNTAGPITRLPIKRLADVCLGKMVQGEPSSGGDVQAPYLRAAHVQPIGRLAQPTEQTMWFRPGELSSLTLLPGDVVVVEGGAGYGRSAVLPEGRVGWGFQNSIVRLRPLRDKACGGFLNYAIQDGLAAGRIALLCNTATIAHFTAEKVAAFPVPAPTLETQRQIADYLDSEVEKIDDLIGKQGQLIATLRERRASVIAQAVTQGLHLHATMKESGVEWLGPIPTHWEECKVKWVGRAIIGLTYSPDDIVSEGTGGTLVLRSGNIQDSRLALDDNVYVTSKIPSQLRLQVGDILICSRNGSARLIGKSAVIPETLAGSSWGAFMSVLRSPMNRYLAWLLRSSIFSQQIGLFATSTINQLTSETLHNFEIPVPPAAEQSQIADHLDAQTAKIDTLIERARRFIEVSKERRAALISAAVTGQIDVRGEGAA